MVVFALVMLSAVAIGAFSLFGGGKSPGESASESEAAAVSAAGSWGEGLTLYESLSSDLPEAAFAFVILSGPDEDGTQAAESVVGSVVGRIVEQGGDAAVYTVAAGTSMHEEAVAHFDVERLPAIITIKRGSTGVLVDGGMTEDVLYQAYLDCCGAGCGPCATCP